MFRVLIFSESPEKTINYQKGVKMKKIAVLLAIATMGLFLSGCAQALMTNHNGFPSAAPGAIITDMTVASYVPQKQIKNYTVVGKVEAEVKTVNYLGIIALGDGSYATLKRMALEKCPGANDIINIEIDARHKNVLCLINEVTTVLRATAIKY
jgi:hypothetical protein